MLRNLFVSCHRTCGPSFDHSRCIRPAVSGSVQQQQQHQQMLLLFMGKLTLLLLLHRVRFGMCYRCFGESCSLCLQGASKFLRTVGYTAHRHTAKKMSCRITINRARRELQTVCRDSKIIYDKYLLQIYNFLFICFRNVKPDDGCLVQPKHVAFLD